VQANHHFKRDMANVVVGDQFGIVELIAAPIFLVIVNSFCGPMTIALAVVIMCSVISKIYLVEMTLEDSSSRYAQEQC